MELTLTREQLLTPLNQIIGAVERKMTFPILANILIELQQGRLTLTGTDLEVELKSSSNIDQSDHTAAITLPGKKLADICKMLPEKSQLKLQYQGNQVTIHAQKSYYKLATMPVDEFPVVRQQEDQATHHTTVTERQLHTLLQNTHFSMAQQDVRFFLNGLLLRSQDQALQAVATDGHRLATCSLTAAQESSWQAIIPRKTINELLRLTSPCDSEVHIQLSQQHIIITTERFTLTSKLIDGEFPDFQRVIPATCEQPAIVDRDAFKECLQRAAILCNEKQRSVVLTLDQQELTIQANNPEQEEASESLAIDYHGEKMDVAFNVNYLLQILAAMGAGAVQLHIQNPSSSMLITETDSDVETLFVIMPMRL